MRIHHGHILGLAAFTIPGTSAFLPLSVAPISYIYAAIFVLIAGWSLVPAAASLPPARICAALLAWIAITMIWTVEPAVALEKYPRLILAVLLGLVPVAAATLLTDEQKALFIKLLIPGYIWCLLLLTLGLMREAGDLLPFIEPHSGVPGKELSRMNRGSTVLLLFLWPVLMLTWRRPVLSLVLCALVVIPSGLSSSNATLAGLFVSGIAFVFSRFLPRATLYAAAACIIGYIAVAPVIHANYLDPQRWGLTWEKITTEKSWLPRSAYHRLLIWNFTAEKAQERPVLGWGFYSSRVMPGGDTKLDFSEDALPLHPHNGVIQIWVELGAIGALLAAVLCLSIVIAIQRLRPWPERAAGTALFTCAFVVVCVSYGIWQSWWIAALFLVSAFFVGAKQDTRQGAGPPDG